MSASSTFMGGPLPARALPRILFVFGKGGVGRSTVATALGLALAERGERVLVLQWAVADAIGPWFGVPAAGQTPVQVSPGLAVANFSLEASLRSYFVDHLHLGLVYRRVIRSEQVWRLIEVAPGLSEIFFLGELWWLTTLAEREAGLAFDRIVVDAPATGHGASLLDVPSTLASMGASGLLELEVRRVTELMADPARVGALVVALPEPLVAAETLELMPRLAERLQRPVLALLVNRSATSLADATAAPRELEAPAGLGAASLEVLRAVHRELRTRSEVERQLVGSLHGTLERGCAGLPETLGASPVEVARTMAVQLGARLLEPRP